MPLIKPRTRGKQFVRLITRLEQENNETLHAYGRFLGEPVEYVLNQLIDTLLAKAAQQSSHGSFGSAPFIRVVFPKQLDGVHDQRFKAGAGGASSTDSSAMRRASRSARAAFFL